MNHYKMNLTERVLKYKKKLQDYELVIETSDFYDLDISFFSCKNFYPITSRDFKEYSKKIQNNTFSKNEEVVELGAGLGGFIEEIYKKNIVDKPTIIDPANYPIMLELLSQGLKDNIHPSINSIFIKLISRCELYLDSTKVNLLNYSLEKAADLAHLHKKFDTIIDHFGAFTYDPCAYNHAQKLLKNEGNIIFN